MNLVKRMIDVFTTAVCAFWCFLLAAFPVEAGRLEEPIERTTANAEAGDEIYGTGDEDEGGKFLAVPVPIVDPSIGNGLALASLYTFPGFGEEGTAPRSTAAAAAGYTDTDTWMVGGGFKFYLADDRYRLGLAGGYGSVNLDFFGIGGESILADNPVGFNIEGGFLRATAQLRVAEDFYVGTELRYANPDVIADLPIDVLPDLSESFTLLGVGPTLEYDSRDEVWWPTSGSQGTANLLWYDKTILSDGSFLTSDARFAHYLSPAEDLVLAGEVRVARASDDAPFFMFPFIDLRGFPSGRYLNTALAQAQAELRWMPFDRFGVVAFAGAGTVASDLGSLPEGNEAYSYGGGLRYRLSEADRMNIGVDLAYDGDETTVYFRIGEAF